ncbi:MAG: DHH family phosphoesterase [Promethearchaeota archaeon]
MKLKNFNEFFINFIRIIESANVKEQKIIITTHINADIDAFSSILGLKFILEDLLNFKKSNIMVYISQVHQSVNRISEKTKVADFFAIVKNKEDLEEFLKNEYILIILDANNLERINLNEILFNNKNFAYLILIDHHQIPNNPNELLQNTIKNDEILSNIIKNNTILIESDVSSTAEIISRIWRRIIREKESKSNFNSYYSNQELQHNVKKKELVAQLILCGIMSDSKNLRYSKNDVVSELAFLIENGGDLQKTRELNIHIIDRREKSARLKGALRVNSIYKIGKWFALITHVNAYEASVCNGLIDLGADIAFCYSKKKEENRLIVRSSEEFQIETKFDFGKFMEELAKELGGTGGGHEGAAGISGKTFPENLEQIIISKLRKKII